MSAPAPLAPLPGRDTRRLLYIAYHFPPIQGSTGIARTLSFARYLPEWQWQVTVLTVRPFVYPDIREQNYAAIPPHVRVVRTLAFDTQRHLAIRGRYPSLLATPDKLQSWIPFATWRAVQIIRRWKPHALVSTYPIASAHYIGYLAHRLTGIPWIADFRDPMVQPNYPEDPRIYRAFQKIERLAFTHAARIVVTTPGAGQLYADRFPDYPRDHIVLISNGFDPQMFADAVRPPQPVGPRRLRLLHSGLLYPEERDPLALFAALAELRAAGRLDSRSVEVVFRASGYEQVFAPHIRRLGLEDLVTFCAPIPYGEALSEMMAADGLLILQAANCNQQIPAKLYEYLYAGRPILCLTDPAGDTGQLMKQLGSRYIAPLDSAADIKTALLGFVTDLQQDRGYVVPPETVSGFSRRTLTGELARTLDETLAEAAGVTAPPAQPSD